MSHSASCKDFANSHLPMKRKECLPVYTEENLNDSYLKLEKIEPGKDDGEDVTGEGIS